MAGWFRRMLGDDPSCGDLVQDTLVAALEQRCDSDERLLAIAKAQLAAHLVAHRRRRALADATLVHDDDTPAQVMLRHDAQKLHAAIATLSQRLREPLELFYFESLQSATIAVRLGVPHATVRTRLHRARLSLEASLR
ncbi:MAG TPA: sigma-70 family RNA polymerase sigma factor [Nannocystaceae bacterium]|nr:sigma-70 family RNA polymerase sigma factor [Nannocystaceae bacterium]